MTTTQTTEGWDSSNKIWTAAVLAVWAGLAYLVGATGIVTAPATETFRPIVLTAVVPVTIFFATYAASARFRDFVLSWDLQTLTGLQHWRVVGFAFLVLYAFDVLPALFAWGAGIGDVLIGLAAPFVVARLRHDPTFARSWKFVTYHVLGLLDFALAVGTATLASGAYPVFLSGAITSAAMEVWPLNIFPSFIVPIFIILHVVTFLKLRALRRPARDRVTNVLQAA